MLYKGIKEFKCRRRYNEGSDNFQIEAEIYVPRSVNVRVKKALRICINKLPFKGFADANPFQALSEEVIDEKEDLDDLCMRVCNTVKETAGYRMLPSENESSELSS